MGQYQDISIKDLVDGINEKYYLPDIQREFVWNTDKNKFEDKICDLFDSIMRGYPIGTLLFWEVNYERLKEDNITILEFIKKSNEDNQSINLDNFRDKDVNLVLDGQQRMTILNLAFRGFFEDKFRGKKKRKVLYFNLLSKKDDSKEINERLYEFKLLESDEPYFKDKEGKLWHKVSLLLKQPESLTDYWEKITTKNKIETKDKNCVLDNLNKFWKIISEKNISYYEIGKEKKDEEALEIFVRVNSGGVTLTYSDLLFSKIKQYWKGGDKKIDAREEFKDFLEEINGDDFNFDNNFILKTSLVLIEKDIRYQVKNFNKENVLLIKKNWEEIKKYMKATVNFLNEIGVRSKKWLGSNNALIPIIYYLYKNSLQEIDRTSNDFDILKKYLYSVLLNGVFGGQSDSLLVDSRSIISSLKGKPFPRKELFESYTKRNKIIRSGDELKDLLKEIRYGTDKCKLVLNIAYNFNLPKEFQEDHLFPRTRSLKKFDKKEVNNVANIQPLGSFTNNIKNDKTFMEWIKEKNRSEDYAELNLIPKMEDYKEDNFLRFLEKRRELILNKIKEFFE